MSIQSNYHNPTILSQMEVTKQSTTKNNKIGVTNNNRKIQSVSSPKVSRMNRAKVFFKKIFSLFLRKRKIALKSLNTDLKKALASLSFCINSTEKNLQNKIAQLTAQEQQHFEILLSLLQKNPPQAVFAEPSKSTTPPNGIRPNPKAPPAKAMQPTKMDKPLTVEEKKSEAIKYRIMHSMLGLKNEIQFNIVKGKAEKLLNFLNKHLTTINDHIVVSKRLLEGSEIESYRKIHQGFIDKGNIVQEIIENFKPNISRAHDNLKKLTNDEAIRISDIEDDDKRNTEISAVKELYQEIEQINLSADDINKQISLHSKSVMHDLTLLLRKAHISENETDPELAKIKINSKEIILKEDENKKTSEIDGDNIPVDKNKSLGQRMDEEERRKKDKIDKREKEQSEHYDKHINELLNNIFLEVDGKKGNRRINIKIR